MRSRLVAAWTIARLAYRADAVAAIVATALFVVQGGMAMLNALFTASAVAAAVQLDGRAAAIAVVGMAVNDTLLHGVNMVGLDLRFRLTEKTGLLIEQQLIDAMTGAPTLDLHERPQHLDRIEVLRKQVAMLSNTVGALLHNVSLFTGFASVIGVLVTVHPLLVLLPIAGIPAVLCQAKATNAHQRTLDATAERQRRADHLFILATTPGPAKELRTFGLAAALVDQHVSFLRSAHRDLDRVSLRWGVASGLAWSTLAVTKIAAVAFVVLQAIDGRASVRDAILVVSLTSAVHGYLAQLNEMVGWLFGTLRAAQRYVEVLRDAHDLSDAAVPWEPAPAPERLRRGITLEGVSFRYPDTERDVLHDVSLNFEAGATVALIGENGAGKSTLIKLLGRFYTPTDGTIRVEGVDLARIDVGAWRARLSGAFQDHARFELVAREVVGVGDLDRVDDEPAVVGALERAGGGELPARLEHGLDTPLGTSFDEGIEPSGGQWQQLALGRALLRDRSLLLLLDEPTSALDPEAEHTLFEGYARAARDGAAETGAITLLVSHRFSTVRMADLIVVMEDGTVVQTGTHDELMAAGGTYAELYAMQASAYR